MAVSEPSSCEGTLPVTRFSVAPEPLLKLTAPPLPIENVFQLMMAARDDWLMVMLLLAGAPMVAVPEVTLPPVGSAGPPARAAVMPRQSAVTATLGQQQRGALSGWNVADGQRRVALTVLRRRAILRRLVMTVSPG